MRIMLVGNPNCGKTTLFNNLTGKRAPVGNWAGVTVTQQQAPLININTDVSVVDLPGVYSLNISEHATSPDVHITTDAILHNDYDLLVNVVDSCSLERHLYLTSQLIERGKPMIVVLTMMDVAFKRGVHIDVQKLSQTLNLPVIIAKEDCASLKQAVIAHITNPTKLQLLQLPTALNAIYAAIKSAVEHDNHTYTDFIVRRVLEGDFNWSKYLHLAPDTDIILADARYQWVHTIVQQVLTTKNTRSNRISAWIDNIVLHRVLALPIFFLLMYAMFFCALNIASVLQPWIETGVDLVLNTTRAGLNVIHTPMWLQAILIDGAGIGVKTTISFTPVMAVMFSCLIFLETTGYMARAAFIMDRAMRFLGLPGKAFIPMIIGFGCNVPAILATRTLDTRRDRLLTILMSPFMSCGARLTIYAVFVAAFFPTNGANIIFALYIIGIIMALLTGLVLRKTLLSNNVAPLILELPLYHKPSIIPMLKEMWHRLSNFLRRAVLLIVPICIVLGSLNVIPMANGLSVLALFGKMLTPLFAPMGIHENNWPAVVGLITGTLAKEVVIGTLNQLYSTMGVVNDYGNMLQGFGSKAAAFAYLLFILLYIPCVSTMAAIRQEASRFWMLYAIVWSLGVAYLTAVLFYQCVTFVEHPRQTCIWVLITIGLLLAFISRHRFKLGVLNVATYS